MSKYYAGIGSRETPAWVCARFSMLAGTLGDEGWTLRSGGAEGADQAFEQGLSRHHPREIYLPWPRFGGHRSPLCIPTTEAVELAGQYHPAWSRCSAAARRLHARNMHQVLGSDLRTPVMFVLCWTAEGKGHGGTGQALRLAQAREIPIFDFGHGPQVYEELQAWLKDRDAAPPATDAAIVLDDVDDAPGMGCGP